MHMVKLSVWFLGAGVLVCAVLSLLFWLVKGHYDDEKDTEFRTSTRFSLNKTFDKKLRCSPPLQVGWFKIYMNIVLPLMAIRAVYDTIVLFLEQTATAPYIFCTIIYCGFAIANCFIFRMVDGIAYGFNIAANLSFLAFLIVSYLGFAQGGTDGFMIVSALIAMVVWLPIIIGNLVYFGKRKELFVLTAKQLKAKYRDDDQPTSSPKASQSISKPVAQEQTATATTVAPAEVWDNNDQPSSPKASQSAPKNDFPIMELPAPPDGMVLDYRYDDVKLAVINPPEREQLKPGDILELRPEPENAYDKKAIAVFDGDIQLGYLHRGRLQDMVHDFKRKEYPILAILTYLGEEANDLKIFLGFYRPPLYQRLLASNDPKSQFRLIRIAKDESLELLEVGQELDVVYNDEHDPPRYEAWGHMFVHYGRIGDFPKAAYELLDSQVKVFIANYTVDDDDKHIITVDIFSY